MEARRISQRLHWHVICVETPPNSKLFYSESKICIDASTTALSTGAVFKRTAPLVGEINGSMGFLAGEARTRSEEHTSELQSRGHLVCRLLLEKKKKTR